MHDSISAVVKLFRESPELNDEQILTRLSSSGMDRELANQLLTFIPMVYVRILLAKMQVQFPEKYEVEVSQKGQRETRFLSEEPVWPAIQNFAQLEIAHGLSSKDLLNVAGRSAEFDAVNQALNAGYKIEGIRLGTTVVNWS